MAEMFDNPLDEVLPETFAWKWQDEVEYNHRKVRYSDRQALIEEAQAKRKALNDTTPDNPLYHRIAISAELAAMRVDMAYIVLENEKLHEYIATIRWLHDQVGILQGAYGHVKMLAENGRINYGEMAKTLKEATTLIRELSDVTAKTSDRPDGKKG